MLRNLAILAILGVTFGAGVGVHYLSGALRQEQAVLEWSNTLVFKTLRPSYAPEFSSLKVLSGSQPNLWVVSGNVTGPNAEETWPASPFVAVVRKVCSSRRSERCWRLERLTIDGKALVEAPGNAPELAETVSAPPAAPGTSPGSESANSAQVLATEFPGAETSDQPEQKIEPAPVANEPVAMETPSSTEALIADAGVAAEAVTASSDAISSQIGNETAPRTDSDSASSQGPEDDGGWKTSLLSALGWGEHEVEPNDSRDETDNSGGTSATISLGPSESDAAHASGDDSHPQTTAEAEPVQTAAIPASPATASYTHWIRLGTFRRPESAPIMWGRLQRSQTDLLGGLSYQITKIRQGEEDNLYLLRAGPLADAEAARSLCRVLIGRGVDCLASRTAGEIVAPPQTALVETEGANLTKAVPAPNSASENNAHLYKLALAHSQDGEAFSKNGDYDEAIQEFNEAIRLNPGFAPAHYGRGEIYFQRGDYQQAIRDFTRTIGLAPDYTFAYYSRGVANERTGETEEAILDFTHTVRLKPSYAPAYNDRARALYSLGYLREALRDSEHAISIAPGTPTYLATHSLILAALGRREGAFATLE